MTAPSTPIQPLRETFAELRAMALADPSARADHPVAPHRRRVAWRQDVWTIILTINR